MATASRVPCQPVFRGGAVLFAPWWRFVVGAGLAAGGVRWRVRSSSRSCSGAVVVIGFRCFGSAVRFARVWSRFVGFPVCVSPRVSGSRVWAVSVPVGWPGVGRVPPPAPVRGRVAWVRG
jgi:hypothetical protein